MNFHSLLSSGLASINSLENHLSPELRNAPVSHHLVAHFVCLLLSASSEKAEELRRAAELLLIPCGSSLQVIIFTL